jgi:hypothetical protein
MTGVTSVTFAEGMTISGSLYMNGMTGVTSVTFTEGMTISGYLDMNGMTGVTSVTFTEGFKCGSLYMNGMTGVTSVTFTEGMTISGSLYMNGMTGVTSVTFAEGFKCGSLYMSDKCSEYLLALNRAKVVFTIENVRFDKSLFDKVRKDILTAQEVFAIVNMEQRRIAYQRMDKNKMKDLPNLKVLNKVKNDGYGYPMKVISFTVEGYDKPFKFLNCFDPSTGREYFLETQSDTCWIAKNKSFGIEDKNFRFKKEW